MLNKPIFHKIDLKFLTVTGVHVLFLKKCINCWNFFNSFGVLLDITILVLKNFLKVDVKQEDFSGKLLEFWPFSQ